MFDQSIPSKSAGIGAFHSLDRFVEACCFEQYHGEQRHCRRNGEQRYREQQKSRRIFALGNEIQRRKLKRPQTKDHSCAVANANQFLECRTFAPALKTQIIRISPCIPCRKQDKYAQCPSSNEEPYKSGCSPAPFKRRCQDQGHRAIRHPV